MQTRVGVHQPIKDVPVDVSIIVFGLLESMSNVALGDSQGMTHQAGDQITVAVVSNDEIWVFTMAGSVKLFFDCCGGVPGKPLQVRPHFKPVSNPR